MKNLLHKENKTIKHLKRWKLYLSIVLIVGIFFYIIILGTISFTKQLFSFTVYAPTIHKVNAQIKQYQKPTQVSPDSIRGQIQQVFGKDSDKAFKLLSCENSTLNPTAVNISGNIPVGSRDIGVFQVNEYWQKTQAKFLFNPEINIRVAKQLYDENGKSFKLWTCGRRLGI